VAVINPPGWLQNAGATHTAEQVRNWQDVLIAGRTGATTLLARGGVHPGLGNQLQVTQSGSPAMSVVVKSGHGVIPGSEGSKQGVYSVMNDADVTLTIAAAHASLNRIDLVCFKVEDQAYSGSVNASSLVVVTGTPAGSPTPPAAPNNSIILAQVSIVANDTSITNGEITDRRQFVSATGGLISVANTTERDALSLYESLGVYRRDSDVVEIYDGSGFRSYWPIHRQVFTAGSAQSSITISNIPTALRMVHVEITSRSTPAVAITGIIMRVGGDTGTNYRYGSMYSQNGSAPSTTSGFTTANPLIGYMPGASATAGVFGSCNVTITGWDRPHNNFLTAISNGGYVDVVGNYIVNVTQWAYSGSNSLTSITILSDSGNIDTGSEIVVTGIYGP